MKKPQNKHTKRAWRIVCVLGDGRVSGDCGHNHRTKCGMKCKHENAGHLMPGDILTPSNYAPIEEGYPVLVEQSRCLDCGAWLSIGPSDDADDRVAIEIRAAEIVAGIVPIFGGYRLIDYTVTEWAGYLRGSAQAPDTADWTDAHYAGYLARCIVENAVIDRGWSEGDRNSAATTSVPWDSSGLRKRLPDSDYGYLAGIIDGEAYLYAGVGDGNHRIRIRVRMCDECVIEWLHVRFGGQRNTWQPQGGRLQYEWCVSAHADVKRILEDVLSYLVAKAQRARLMLAWLADKKDSSWHALISTNTRTAHPVRTRVNRSDAAIETKGPAGETSTGNARAARE